MKGTFTQKATSNKRVMIKNKLILYIHPRSSSIGFQTCIPVGIVSLVGSLLKAGYVVHGINLQFEYERDPRFNFEKWLQSQEFDIVLIDLHWLHHSYDSIELARMVKCVRKNSSIILGGLTSSFFGKEILKDYWFVDFVVRGEGEPVIAALVKAIYDKLTDYEALPNLLWKKDGEVHSSKHQQVISNLNNIDCTGISFMRDWERMLENTLGLRMKVPNSDKRAYWLINGRGCHLGCIYCGGSNGSFETICARVNLEFRSIKRIVEDIKILKRLNIGTIGFTHDIVETDGNCGINLLEQIQSLDLGVVNHLFRPAPTKFTRMFANSVDPDRSLLGLTVISGDENVRRINGRLYSNRDLLNFLHECYNVKIPVMLSFSCNVPGSSVKSFEKTIELLKRILDLKLQTRLSLGLSLAMLEPGSPISQYANIYGVRAYWTSFSHYYKRFSPGFKEDLNVLGESTLREITGFELEELKVKDVVEHIRNFRKVANGMLCS